MNNDIKQLNINTKDNSYTITIGKNLLKNVDKYFSLDRKILIVTDDNIPLNYINDVKDKIKNCHIITIPNGEENKNITNYQNIISELIKNNFTRKDAIIAIGGGVIGDMSAFAASTYMRGIDFYNIPTTLLSQVDSSIGGKTAIDFLSIKNIIGTFYQPKGVLIDIDTLQSLPKRQLYNGLVESIKMAATFDKEFFNFIKDSNDIFEEIETVIYKSLLIKKYVVEQDEKEQSIRKVLNFGHTIGHAIEESLNLKYFHGECVGVGMLFFSSDEVKSKIKETLTKYNLPTHLDYDKNKVIELIKHDKKSQSETISIIYVNEIGTYEIRQMTLSEIGNLL
ncbi:MAG: 3-dehydroquinate synthase [Lachnospiraceae bacterium]|nr:3-dehydroquinate synthase [Lachnospiraceae bacterium]